MVQEVRGGVKRDFGIEPLEQPGAQPPKLPRDLAALTDSQLMTYLSRFTRWADFFASQVATEDIRWTEAKARVERDENLFILRTKADQVQSGKSTRTYISDIRVEMEYQEDIVRLREAARMVQNRLKLMTMLFESAERDAAVCSRELTRRTSTIADSVRRVERHMP